jgi:signal transduction histidine kinase
VSGAADPRFLRTTPADAPASSASRLLRRIAGGRAEERVYRVLAFAFLPGAILFGLLGAPSAVAQQELWPAWWTVTMFALGIVPSIALGAGAFVLPLAILRSIARVNVVATLVALASAPFVVVPTHGLPTPIWLADICGLGLIAAALAVRPWAAVGVAALGGALSFVDRVALEGADGVVVGAQTGLYVVLFTLTFIALGVSSLAAARAADVAETGAEAATAGAAADAARERERARINELVHDRVLATLLTAAREIPGSGGLERRDAHRALEGLQALLRDDLAPADLTAEEFLWKVQAIATDLLPEALFNYEVSDGEVLPGEVVEALVDAAEEAMRNSLRHAGPANRTVHVRIQPGEAGIDVLDDGVGFERAAVPAGRLGLSDSIEGRMRALDGGSAVVVSQPAVGTRVTLYWAAP